MTSADEPRVGRRVTKGRLPVERAVWARASVLLATALSVAACGGEDTAVSSSGPAAGSAGKAGAAGSAGAAGAAGKAGSSGGTAGKAGSSGASGAAGKAGSGGASGTAGSAGAGAAGAAGVTSSGGSMSGGSAGAGASGGGAAGQAGAAGAAGSTGGAAGQGGSAAGQGGSAGKSGAAGQGGSGGQGGVNECPGQQKKCGDACVPINDPATGCGPVDCTPCAIDHATSTCSAGECAIATCEFGFADCDGNLANGCEVSIADSLTDCGKCGEVCGPAHATPLCTGGVCGKSSCDAGFLDCNGNAADGCEVVSASNTSNCGTCGNACKAGEQCEAGVCGTFCAPGLANCDGDATNGCETTLGTAAACSGCGDACTFAGGTGTCVAGKCSIGTCNSPQADCDNTAANGCETNTQASVTNCGACGNECPTGPHAAAVCTIGTCGIKCDANFGDCDSDPTTGCERSLATDPLSCGACGVACTTANGVSGCAGGTCQVASCNPGFANCNNLPGDGCEINTGSNTQNCGGCGIACPGIVNGSPACSGGACGAACAAGFANCDGSLATGCETNIVLDVNNCGGCNTKCQLPNATAKCGLAGCAISVCNQGFADCDGDPSNGCEVNTQTNSQNCGVCSKVCAAPSGTPICVAGNCQIAAGSCQTGRRDCDGNSGNGCEVDITNDTANCGNCGVGCLVQNGTPACASGSCAVAGCTAPFANCNNNPSDGCERNTSNDINNCGGCGKVCSSNGGTPSCSNGVCGISCFPGRGNCDNDIANGCETQTSSSTAHCGVCGNACTGAANVLTPACNAGNCAVGQCTASWYNTDGSYSNGCECKEDLIADNCGGAFDLGTIQVDGTQISSSSANNLVGGLNDEDWYKVTFVTGSSCNFNPRVALNGSGNNIRMQVYTGCAGTVANGGFQCSAAEGGNSSKDIETWEYTHRATCGDGQPTIDATPGSGSYVQIPTTIYIRVYRTGSSITCQPYTLSINN